MLAKNWVRIMGVVLLLVGATFFFQGIGVLPGSRMTGQMFWAWVGLVLLLVGAGAVFFGWRGRRIP